MIVKTIQYPGYKTTEPVELGTPTITSTPLFINNQGCITTTTTGNLTVNTSGYVTSGYTIGSGIAGIFTIGSPHGFGAQTVRECFPKEWKITSIVVSSSGYSHTTVELIVEGEYDYDTINQFWQSRLYSRSSSWSPDRGQLTNFGFNVQVSDSLDELHKELFDEQFIKDFEEVEK